MTLQGDLELHNQCLFDDWLMSYQLVLHQKHLQTYNILDLSSMKMKKPWIQKAYQLQKQNWKATIPHTKPWNGSVHPRPIAMLCLQQCSMSFILIQDHHIQWNRINGNCKRTI